MSPIGNMAIIGVGTLAISIGAISTIRWLAKLARRPQIRIVPPEKLADIYSDIPWDVTQGKFPDPSHHMRENEPRGM